jgi:hypothetical protein
MILKLASELSPLALPEKVTEDEIFLAAADLPDNPRRLKNELRQLREVAEALNGLLLPPGRIFFPARMYPRRSSARLLAGELPLKLADLLGRLAGRAGLTEISAKGNEFRPDILYGWNSKFLNETDHLMQLLVSVGDGRLTAEIRKASA